MTVFGNSKHNLFLKDLREILFFQDEELSSEPSVQNVDFIKDIKEIKTRKV